MKKYQQFIVFWLVNFILIFFAPYVFPANFKLGNYMFTSIQSAIFTSFVWNYFVWNTEKYLKDFDIKLKGENQMMIAYLAVNFASLWVLARFAVLTGFGVSSYLYVLLLAFVANISQFIAWKAIRNK